MGSSPSSRTTCSWRSPRRPTACWSWCPQWAISCPAAARFRVHGSLPEPNRSAAALSVILERERTHEFEPAFGLRKLVDVGARSIYSSPFQDPTTSVQAINAIHDILRRLARREFPSGRHSDANGRVRLVVRVMSWEGYVRLSFDELRLAGAGSPPVPRRPTAPGEGPRTGGAPRRRP